MKREASGTLIWKLPPASVVTLLPFRDIVASATPEFVCRLNTCPVKRIAFGPDRIAWLNQARPPLPFDTCRLIVFTASAFNRGHCTVGASGKLSERPLSSTQA